MKKLSYDLFIHSVVDIDPTSSGLLRFYVTGHAIDLNLIIGNTILSPCCDDRWMQFDMQPLISVLSLGQVYNKGKQIFVRVKNPYSSQHELI